MYTPCTAFAKDRESPPTARLAPKKLPPEKKKNLHFLPHGRTLNSSLRIQTNVQEKPPRLCLINVFGMAKAWQRIKLIDVKEKSKNVLFEKVKSKNVWHKKMKKNLFCSNFFI
jgi:hypothetical protein